MSDRKRVIATAGYALAAALIVAAGPPPVLAAVCLVPLVLFAPGYALLLALGAPDTARGSGMRWLWSVVFSMTAVVLGGLVLDALFALTTAAWAGWLVSLTCTLCAVAWLRLRGSAAPATQSGARPPMIRPIATLPATTVAAALAAVLLVGAAVALTERSARGSFDTPVTQLSLVLIRSRHSALRLSVTNLSSATEHLALRLTDGTQPARTIELAVGPNRIWSRLIAATNPVTAALVHRHGRTPFTEVTWAAGPAAGGGGAT